jgi:hypothetical protein
MPYSKVYGLCSSCKVSIEFGELLVFFIITQTCVNEIIWISFTKLKPVNLEIGAQFLNIAFYVV